MTSRLKRIGDEEQSPASKKQKPDVAVNQSQRSLPDLPNEVLQKVFSQIGSVPFKCEMRLVNNRWNGLLRHADSFAASLNLSLHGSLSSDCVAKDESGRLFPELTLSLPDLFDKLLPNLKLITSLRLHVIRPGRSDSILAFINFLVTQHPANVQLSALCIEGAVHMKKDTFLTRLIDRYQSTLHSLTGNALGSMVVFALPQVGMCPNMSELEMNYDTDYMRDMDTYEQIMHDSIQFFKVLTDCKQKINLTLNANSLIRMDNSLMIKMLESLPKYDECSVTLRLNDRDMAVLQRRGHVFRDLSWLGAVEEFALTDDTYLRPEASRLLMQLLPGMRRLRSLRIKKFMYSSHKSPLQFDDQTLSDTFYHWLITESPAGVSVDFEMVSVSWLQLNQQPGLFLQQMKEDVAKLNAKYKDYDVSIEQDSQYGYKFNKEHRRHFHIRCCLKIQKEEEEVRLVRFDVHKETY